jgi:hypothetical protein
LYWGIKYPAINIEYPVKLRAFMARSKPKFQLVTDYPVTDYKCGARSGDRVRLRREIVVRDNKGEPTGAVHRVGEILSVINGSAVPPLDLRLRQPDGHRHTWSDDNDFWSWFEKI